MAGEMIFFVDGDEVASAVLARTQANRDRGSIDLMVMEGTRDTPDWIGVAGEAAGRQWKPWYDWTPLVLDGPDPGYDAISPNGRTLDIKSTSHEGGHLLVPEHQLPVSVDRLILATVYETAVKFVGWTSSRIFTRYARRQCIDCQMFPQSGVWMCSSRLIPMELWEDIQ